MALLHFNNIPYFYSYETKDQLSFSFFKEMTLGIQNEVAGYIYFTYLSNHTIIFREYEVRRV